MAAKKPTPAPTDARPTGIGPAKPKGGRPAKGAEQAHIAARRARVESLELAGASLSQMATAVEVDKATVIADLRKIRDARREHHAGGDLDAMRDLELARLEQQRSQLAPSAARGTIAAHTALIRVAERKAKLLGLDAPQQVAVSGEIRATIASHLDREELAAMLVEGVGLDDLLDGSDLDLDD